MRCSLTRARCRSDEIGFIRGPGDEEEQQPDQIVQPFWFGDAERKATCLWLKGLPKLEATKTIEPIVYRYRNGRTAPAWNMNTISLPAEERAKVRSKTFPGIAKAMAEQWGNYLLGD